MRLLNLSNEEIDKISKEWSKLPIETKDKYKNVYFNMVDKRLITDHGYNMIMKLIKQNTPKEEENIQYVDYNDGQFTHIDQLYGMNKPNKFISKLITQAKERGKLTKSQDFYLMYYLKNGQTPYDAKLLPNNS